MDKPKAETIVPAHRTETIEKGSVVTYENTLWAVELLVDFKTLVATNVETGETRALPLADVVLARDGNDEARSRARPIDAPSAEDWRKAWERLEAIRPLLERERHGRHDVEEQAAKVGRTASTLYTWLARYRTTRDLTVLIPGQRGWRKGSGRISAEAEAIIAAAIKDVYLTGDRRGVKKVVDAVKDKCRARGIAKPPSEPTIRARIARIPEKERMRKRGQAEAARKRFTPVPGTFPGADAPLAVLQIDHTLVDLMVVDDVYRLPIGRPWLTVAGDVYSRMVAGLYSSFDAPSQTSVAMCIAQAVLPKEALLLRLGIDADWPVWGWPTTVHADNAGEFRSDNFHKACARHKVSVKLRPLKRPHYGAHIERLLGTLMTEVHDLPGTTFSSVAEKGEHAPEKRAVMTLSEFERWLVGLICNVYHKRKHATIETSPLKQWEFGVFGNATTPGAGMQARPENGQDIVRDFLPTYHRTVQTTGAKIDKWCYFAPVLRQWVNATEPEEPTKKRKFAFRRDPRDVSRVWFFDPETEQYFDVPTTDQSMPPISVWERDEIRKHLRAQGIDEETPAAIARAREELRNEVEAAEKRTRRARRTAQRRRTHEAERKAAEADARARGENVGRDTATTRTESEMTYEPVAPYGAVE